MGRVLVFVEIFPYTLIHPDINQNSKVLGRDKTKPVESFLPVYNKALLLVYLAEPDVIFLIPMVCRLGHLDQFDNPQNL
jgi:hypothetical protein